MIAVIVQKKTFQPCLAPPSMSGIAIMMAQTITQPTSDDQITE